MTSSAGIGIKSEDVAHVRAYARESDGCGDGGRCVGRENLSLSSSSLGSLTIFLVVNRRAKSRTLEGVACMVSSVFL
jgi:hypothetical protein